MKVRLSNEVEFDSIVDGEGLRTVIWMQGCSHNCPSCHNPKTHDFNGGFLVDIEDIKKDILMSNNGITLSGGDPMFQIPQALELAIFCQENNLNVWCYTGFIYEKLVEMASVNEKLKELLQCIDVLVDGPFIEEVKDFSLKYRGSKNQRVIECKKSYVSGKIIHHDLKKQVPYKKYLKKDYVFI